MKVYEWLDDRGKGEITDWPRLQSAQQARLDQKIDMLVNAEVDPKTRKANLPQTLLAGPNFGGQQHIYKLKGKGNVAMRPMVCLGPFGDDEWTILHRAVERDNVLIPADAADRAEARRMILKVNRLRRRLLRDDGK